MMKKLLFILATMTTTLSYSQESEKTAAEIIALETSALERWNHGDINGYLDLYAEDIVYFDPMIDQRMDGLQNVRAYYKPLEGKINVTEYQLINPKVQAVSNMAVLTFNLKSVEGKTLYHWNCTEVYRKDDENKWKIIQTHWSYVKPDVKLN
jgi:ketosteroid isomerase-like protein